MWASGRRRRWPRSLGRSTLIAATEEELTRVNDIGPKVAATVGVFSNERNLALVERLRGYGLTFTAERKVRGTALAG
jgi:DNA ligase (NAD+)